MAMIRFRAQIATDPATAMPRPELVGLSGQIVQEGTTTPVAIYEDHAMTLPILDSTLVITDNAFVPQFYVEDTYELDWWDGTNRVPIDSNAGSRDAALEAATNATVAVGELLAEMSADVATARDAAEAAQAQVESIVEGLDNAGAILPEGGNAGTDVLYRGATERTGVWLPAPTGGGTGTTISGAPSVWPSTFPASAHNHPASQISDATTVGKSVMTATDAAAARTAIGAGTGNGTSNLALGSTATTAAPGNHAHGAVAVTVAAGTGLAATDVQAALAELKAAIGTGGGTGTLPAGIEVGVEYTTTQPTRASLGLQTGARVTWYSPTQPIIGGAYADATLDSWVPIP
jgi:hypothetical protein